MMKRILAGAAAAGLAATLFAAGPADAASCGQTQSAALNPQGVTVPGRGTTTIYRSPGTPGPTTTGGYIGVTGDAGFLEVGGDAKTGGGVQGEAKGTPVDGKLTLTPSGAAGVCVAGTKVR